MIDGKKTLSILWWGLSVSTGSTWFVIYNMFCLFYQTHDFFSLCFHYIEPMMWCFDCLPLSFSAYINKGCIDFSRLLKVNRSFAISFYMPCLYTYMHEHTNLLKQQENCYCKSHTWKKLLHKLPINLRSISILSFIGKNKVTATLKIRVFYDFLILYIWH